MIDEIKKRSITEVQPVDAMLLATTPLSGRENSVVKKPQSDATKLLKMTVNYSASQVRLQSRA